MTVMSAATAASKKAVSQTAAAEPTVDIATFENEPFIKELKRRLVESEIDPDRFDPELEELLEQRGGEGVESPDDLATAADWWRRGDKREALHFLEYALGRDFSGLGDLKPEDLL